MRRLLAVLTLHLLVLGGDGYRYLVVFPMPTASHAILGRGVVGALTDQGHQVTHITALPEKNPNKLVTEVGVSFMFDYMRMTSDFFKTEHKAIDIKGLALNMSKNLVSSKPIQDLLMDRSQKFDAVISEWFFNEFYTGFAQVFECPWMMLAPSGMLPSLEYVIGHVNSPAVSPIIITDYTVPMTFTQRVVNTFMYIVSLFSTVYVDHPREERLYHEVFSAGARARNATLAPYADAVANISVIFTNTHPTIGPPLASPHNLIHVSGYHIREDNTPLPEDLLKLLDGAKEGVLYFSLGSNLKSKDMPLEMREELLAMFARLPLTVLWKFETELPNAPQNVHVRSWLPQSKVLTHKNVRVFVTHGGMLSGTEALAAGTPLVTVPMYGDQHSNARRAEKAGYSLTVPFAEPDFAGRLHAAIETILKDDRFAQRVRELSALFRDRPLPPARLLSYWAEHVVRTGGARHMRSVSLIVPWWQRLLLDVIGSALAVLILLVVGVKRLYRRFCGKTSSRSTAKNSEKKKRN